MYIYICVCVYMYICTYNYICVCIYTWCIYMYICTHSIGMSTKYEHFPLAHYDHCITFHWQNNKKSSISRSYMAYMYTHTHTYIYMHVHSYMHIHVCICIYIYMYIFTYIHIYFYTWYIYWHTMIIASPSISKTIKNHLSMISRSWLPQPKTWHFTVRVL